MRICVCVQKKKGFQSVILNVLAFKKRMTRIEEFLILLEKRKLNSYKNYNGISFAFFNQIITGLQFLFLFIWQYSVDLSVNDM